LYACLLDGRFAIGEGSLAFSFVDALCGFLPNPRLCRCLLLLLLLLLLLQALQMPALSPTMEQGNIVSWQVKEGDEVAPGTVLAEIETDKATLAFENQDEGYVAKILAPAGSRDIKVGR
jgi:hypothetical protein